MPSSQIPTDAGDLKDPTAEVVVEEVVVVVEEASTIPFEVSSFL